MFKQKAWKMKIVAAGARQTRSKKSRSQEKKYNKICSEYSYFVWGERATSCKKKQESQSRN